VESEEKVRQILAIYETVFYEGRKNLADVYQGEYTNGHYKRGVE
jgi:putative protease